jgi:hypothetical protein
MPDFLHRLLLKRALSSVSTAQKLTLHLAPQSVVQPPLKRQCEAHLAPHVDLPGQPVSGRAKEKGLGYVGIELEPAGEGKNVLP